MDTELLRIGELSQRHGLSTAAVRYYERLGLLGHPERAHNGYRLFNSDDDARLRFILRGKALDLTLEEIRSLLDAWHEGRCQDTRTALRHLVAHKIREAHERAREAEAFAAQLTHVYERLGQPPATTASNSCGCIPELPVAGAEALMAELAQIEQSVCSCGGRIGESDGCPCGCCAAINSAGGGDHMPDVLTDDAEQVVGSSCPCCAPASKAEEAQAPAQASGCNCGSGSSEGCGPDCGCGTSNS